MLVLSYFEITAKTLEDVSEAIKLIKRVDIKCDNKKSLLLLHAKKIRVLIPVLAQYQISNIKYQKYGYVTFYATNHKI